MTGAFPEETPVPSITEYATTYRINPATALKGINLLVEQGLLYKKRGWKIEIINAVEGTSGGYSQIEFMVKGENVYSKINPEYTELLRVQNSETDFDEYINILKKGRELAGCGR